MEYQFKACTLRTYSNRARALPLALPLANGSHTHFPAASLAAVALLGVNDTVQINRSLPSDAAPAHTLARCERAISQQLKNKLLLLNGSATLCITELKCNMVDSIFKANNYMPRHFMKMLYYLWFTLKIYSFKSAM